MYCGFVKEKTKWLTASCSVYVISLFLSTVSLTKIKVMKVERGKRPKAILTNYNYVSTFLVIFFHSLANFKEMKL